MTTSVSHCRHRSHAGLPTLPRSRCTDLESTDRSQLGGASHTSVGARDLSPISHLLPQPLLAAVVLSAELRGGTHQGVLQVIALLDADGGLCQPLPAAIG